MRQPSPTCQSPIAWETLVAYWAAELSADEEEATELHLMGCAACTALSRRAGATIAAIREQPAAPALGVIDGGRPSPVRRRRAALLVSAGVALLAAAALLLLLLPRRPPAMLAQRLPAPVRDAAPVVVAVPTSVDVVRLEPELPEGISVDGARLRRVDGPWLTVTVERGPPFTVVVKATELSRGRHELELVSLSSGTEASRGFYRFTVARP